MINVRDIGAVGDGVADDTAAFLTAIDMATSPGDPAISTRKAIHSLYAPNGSYVLSEKLPIESVIGFKLFGESMFGTRLMAKGSLPCVLDLNGCFGGEFESFTIRSKDGGTNDTFDAGIYYHWDRNTSQFISSENRFRNINVADGKFKTAYQIGSWRHLGLGDQEDQTYWYGCRASGKWLPGETTWWQHGFNIGSGKFGNNLIHHFDGLHATHCRNGITVDAGQASILGAALGANEVDVNLMGVTSYFFLKGGRSEKSARFIQTAGPVSWASEISFEDFQWRTGPHMASDKRVIFYRFPGLLSLKRISISGDEGIPMPPRPKGYFAGNKAAFPISRLMVDIAGLSIGGGQTLQGFFEYEQESTDIHALGLTELRPGGGSGAYIPMARTTQAQVGPVSNWMTF